MALVVVLGHFPDYLNLAVQVDAKVFDISPQLWHALDDDNRWARNRQFLDDQIAAGATFLLSTPPDRARSGSYFEMELRYLISVGFVARRGATHWEFVR